MVEMNAQSITRLLQTDALERTTENVVLESRVELLNGMFDPEVNTTYDQNDVIKEWLLDE